MTHSAEKDAPCGCEWDGDHCPHCGTVCHPSGDGWSPTHTVKCHSRATEMAYRIWLAYVREQPLQDTRPLPPAGGDQ